MKKVIICLLCSFIFFAPSCKKESNNISSNTNPVDLLPEDFRVFRNIFDGAGIGAGVWLADDVVVVFDKTGDEYAWIENGVVMDKRRIDDSESLFKSSGNNEVTAAVILKTTLYLFGGNGAIYRSVSIEDITKVKGKWNQPDFFTPRNTSYLLSSWGTDYSCPFNTITAALGRHPNVACTNNYIKGDYLIFFNKKQKQYSIYRGPESNFEVPFNNTSYTLAGCPQRSRKDLNLDVYFEATFVYPVGDKVYEVFFLDQGKEFVYSEIGIDQASEVYRID